MSTKPRALALGDTIALVAPSGRVTDEKRVDLAVAALDSLGFAVREYPSCREGYGYLAGTDERRAADLNEAFADGEIDGIVCIKGGYGSPRILDRLDYETISRHPKAFVGYSDITAIHLALLDRCFLATFHAPMPSSDMASSFHPFSREAWLSALTSPEPLGRLPIPPGSSGPRALRRGLARGELVGGNLSLIAATLGTPYGLKARGRILFLEDIGEAPYRVDRMLTQLRLAGVFDECAGIVLGDWKNCGPDAAKPDFELEEIFHDILGELDKPVIAGIAAGHCEPTLTLPLGCMAELDARSSSPGLSMLESATR